MNAVDFPMTESLPPPAGDVDYGLHGRSYTRTRQTDPRIAARVHAALGNARTVLNIGAGAGSYEPADRHVIAVEPSATMRAQRPRHLAPAIHGIAESLPLDDQSVDAAMAMITIHQWRDVDKGLSELRRVTRGPVVILTFDGDAMDRFWLAHYAPALMASERPRFPSLEKITSALGGATVHGIPIPNDCVDGFMEAYYARPEAFLDASVRASQSSWSFLRKDEIARIVQTLSEDLTSGEWDRRFGEWRTAPFFEGSLRLIVSGAITPG